MALIVFKYGIHGNPEGQQVMLILVKWKKNRLDMGLAQNQQSMDWFKGKS